MFSTLFQFSWRRYQRLWLSLALGLFGFQWMMASMYESLTPMFSTSGLGSQAMPDLLNVFTGGTSILDPVGWLGTGYAHPIPLVLMLTWSIVVPANAIAKEIEDGTAELLFARPIARSQVLAARVSHFLVGLIGLMVASAFGTLLGLQLSPLDGVSLEKVVFLNASFVPATLLISGLCFALSAAYSQRSTAVSMAIIFTVISYVINFAGQLWEPMRGLLDYSIFYHTVAATWATDGMNTPAVLITTGIFVLMLIVAFERLQHRNITP
jgi:ABC-2 type transport system permease protein